jgi:hypothetical protein
MAKFAWVLAVAALAAATAAAAQSSSRPARHLEGRERVDHSWWRQRASRHDCGERTGAALGCLYADDRQAGWAPLLRNFFIGARRLESCRRDLAQRHDLFSRRRRLFERDHAGARPDGALLSQARARGAACLLRGIDETAVGRLRLHRVITWLAWPAMAAPAAPRPALCAPLRSRQARASPPSRRRCGSADRAY